MIELQRLFPLLSPVNEELTRYLGYLSIDDDDFQISIDLKGADDLKGAEIRLDTRLEPFRASFRAAIENRLNRCDSLSAFLTDLKEIIRNRLKRDDDDDEVDIDGGGDTNAADSLFALTAVTHLIRELDTLGWSRVSSMNSDLSRVTLTHRDRFGRPHDLAVTVSPRFPHVAPTFSSQLPLSFDDDDGYEWRCGESSLSSLFTAFSDRVSECGEFWSAVKDIDDELVVLEPTTMTATSFCSAAAAATYRRIAIDRNVSLLIEIDPRKPFDLPEARFLGQPSHVRGGKLRFLIVI